MNTFESALRKFLFVYTKKNIHLFTSTKFYLHLLKTIYLINFMSQIILERFNNFIKRKFRFFEVDRKLFDRIQKN